MTQEEIAAKIKDLFDNKMAGHIKKYIVDIMSVSERRLLQPKKAEDVFERLLPNDWSNIERNLVVAQIVEGLKSNVSIDANILQIQFFIEMFKGFNFNVSSDLKKLFNHLNNVISTSGLNMLSLFEQDSNALKPLTKKFLALLMANYKKHISESNLKHVLILESLNLATLNNAFINEVEHLKAILDPAKESLAIRITNDIALKLFGKDAEKSRNHDYERLLNSIRRALNDVLKQYPNTLDIIQSDHYYKKLIGDWTIMGNKSGLIEVYYGATTNISLVPLKTYLAFPEIGISDSILKQATDLISQLLQESVVDAATFNMGDIKF
jgi:hypothetical protein